MRTASTASSNDRPATAGTLAASWMGWAACASAVPALALALGCGSPAATPGTIDAAVRSDAAGPPSDASFPDGGAIGPLGRSELDADEVACADFLNDGMGEADCADVHCGTTRVCCVESTSDACCGAPAITGLALDFRASACTDDTAAAMCASGVTGFGTAASAFVRNVDEVGSSCADGTGAMAPQGGERSDAGLLFDQTHDTGAAAVALEAHVGIGGATSGSIDAIAIGLTSQTDLGATGRVRPSVAVVVSATDQTIRAVAGDVVFEAYPLAPVFARGGCHEIDVRIETSPRGTFTASFRPHDDGAPLAWTALFEGSQRFTPEPLAHPVVYGRTTNPGIEGVHAWIRSFGVASHLCDVLAPARSPSTIIAGTVTATNLRSLSRLGGNAAYEIDGSIYAAGVDGTGHVDATATQLLDPVTEPSPFYAQGVFDPELAQIGTNVRLYFTGVSDTGVRSIGYVDYAPDLSARVNESVPRQLFDPSIAGVLGADGPAYLETLDASGVTRRLVVFRALVSDPGGLTHTDIRAVELHGSGAILGGSAEVVDLADSAEPAYYSRSSPLSPTAALYRNREGDDSAFDRDEVAQPELVQYHGVFRIFFAGRRGARWSIGMLRSPDFQYFDLATTEPVLTGSSAGFDAVSVSDPDVFVEDDRLSLYYSGTNGVETRPGLATQAIPTP